MSAPRRICAVALIAAACLGAQATAALADPVDTGASAPSTSVQTPAGGVLGVTDGPLRNTSAAPDTTSDSDDPAARGGSRFSPMGHTLD